MRDWSALVHHHLGSVRVDERRRRDISAELAAHLEDAYDGARRSGCTEAEATAHALARVPDWSALAEAVQRSTDEETTTRQAITVLLPGTTMLLAAATGMALVVSATPADRWLDPRWHVHALAAGLALLYYLLLGAIGAAWSRHVGGSPGERLAAGAFPLVLHVAVVALGVGEDLMYAASRGAVGRHMDIHFINVINMVLVMLVAPGTALLLGVLPFPRRSARPGAHQPRQDASPA